MNLDVLWRDVEAGLSSAVAAALRPPITEAGVREWSAVAGPLPTDLTDLYVGHEGTEQVGGGSGFSFIGNWYPLPVDAAINSYRRMRMMTDAWEQPPLIPFAVGTTGCYLAMPADGSGTVHIMYLDTPGREYLPDIEALMTATVEGLRGTNTDYRAELTDDYLLWINLEEEAEDLGY